MKALAVNVDRTQRVLAGALLVQLVILAIVYHPFVRSHAAGGQTLLPTLASITPEKIEIASGEGSVTLERRSGAWVLAQPAGYPILPGKAEKLIQDIEHLTAGRQVSSDKSSHPALKVATDQFERRVRIWAKASGAPNAELFVGSSLGSGVSHMRVGGNDRVVEASGLSSYDVPADAASWIERRLVPWEAEEVGRIEVANRKDAFALELTGGAWRIRSPMPRSSAALDSTKVLELARTLTGMSIDQPIGAIDAGAQGLADPEATVTLGKRAAGDSAMATASAITIRIGGEVPNKTDTRYAVSSAGTFAVTIPKYSYERALSVKLEELLKK